MNFEYSKFGRFLRSFLRLAIWVDLVYTGVQINIMINAHNTRVSNTWLAIRELPAGQQLTTGDVFMQGNSTDNQLNALETMLGMHLIVFKTAGSPVEARDLAA